MTDRRSGAAATHGRGDRIELLGVRAFGHHGVLDHEKRDGQEFVVDVVMDLDLRPAGRSDDLDDTVSYAEVAADGGALVGGEPLDLIETLAERVAAGVLRRPRVEGVEVTVHKPQAPVGVPFGDVRVRVVRTRCTPVVIALGSNLGDPQSTLRGALDRLAARGVHVDAESARYRTAPVGGPEQPDYVNAVVTATTHLSPWSLLAALHEVEADLGRVRTVRWGPRTVDLDLIQYGDPRDGSDVVLGTQVLTLPHPRAHERAFVLVPWLDADPAATLRVDGVVRPVTELVGEADTGGVDRLEEG